MKHFFKYITIVLTSIFTLLMVISCEETITNFEIKSQPAKVVINGIFETDSVIKVHISKSMGIDEKSLTQTIIVNAKVGAFENDKHIGELQHMGDGYYVLDNYYPKELATYRIEVQMENMPLAWAETTVPKSPDVKEVVKSYRNNVPERWSSGNFTSNRLNMEIKLNSDPAILHYVAVSAMGSRYRIEYGNYECKEVTDPETGFVYMDCFYPDPDTLGVYKQMIGIGTNDKRNLFYLSQYERGMSSYLLSNFDYEESGYKQYFSNEHFINEALNINVDIVSYYLGSDIDSKFDLWIYNYDEVYYKFLLSLARLNATEDFLFAEKVSIYSNVENGLGMLGAASGTLIKVEYDVEEFYR